MQKPTLFSHSDQFVQDHYRLSYMEQNWIQKELNHDSIYFELNDFYEELRSAVVEILIKKKIINQPVLLEELHLNLPDELKAYGNDGLGKIGTFFYEDNLKFLEVLHKFIYEILYKKVIQQPFYFQATPTFRVHCPGAINSSFFPHYHTDLALGHPPYEINLWIPLTPIMQGHGFYLASLENSRKIAEFIDYDLRSLMNESVFRNKEYLEICESKLLPVMAKSGQGLLFDGRCFHTAMPVHDHTRMSVDFRIVLQEDFTKAGIIYENRGLRRQLKLLPGDYYYHKNSAELFALS